MDAGFIVNKADLVKENHESLAEFAKGFENTTKDISELKTERNRIF